MRTSYAAEHGITLIFSPEIARLVNENAAARKAPVLAAQEASDPPLGNGIPSLTGKAFSRPAQGMAAAS